MQRAERHRKEADGETSETVTVKFSSLEEAMMQKDWSKMRRTPSLYFGLSCETLEQRASDGGQSSISSRTERGDDPACTRRKTKGR